MDKTFVKGLVLLEALAKHERGSGVTELANQLMLNKSNVHRLLQALVHQGFARKNEDTGRYELTMKLWELGSGLANRLDVRTEALPFMKELAEQTQETVHLSLLDGVEVLYIEKMDSPQPVRAYTTVGGRSPAQCVATGKALLAWASEDTLNLLKNRLKPYTPVAWSSLVICVASWSRCASKGLHSIVANGVNRSWARPRLFTIAVAWWWRLWGFPGLRNGWRRPAWCRPVKHW